VHEIKPLIPFRIGWNKLAKVSYTFPKYGDSGYSISVELRVTKGAIILFDIKFETEPDSIYVRFRGGNREDNQEGEGESKSKKESQNHEEKAHAERGGRA